MNLYYFDFAGRAEAIRLLLHHAKIPFQDIRIKSTDWKTLKNSPIFEYHSLPVLQLDNGLKLSQSHAILEYLGLTYGYMPYDESLVYQVKNVMDAVEDVFNTIFSVFAPPELNQYEPQALKDAQNKLFNEGFPFIFDKLQDKLKQNEKNNFIISDKWTIADFAILQLFKTIFNPLSKPIVDSLLEKRPLLLKYVNSKFEEFKEYYEARNTKYKLYYFDTAGRAEPIRLLLRHAGIKFEDYRMTRETFNMEVNQGKFEYNQVPALQENDKIFVQTDAILQKLAVKFNYLSKDPKIMYMTLNICSGMKDLFDAVVKFMFSKITEQSKIKLKESLINESFPNIFGIIEKRLNNKENKMFLIGSNYSLADFYLIGFSRSIIYNPMIGFSRDIQRSLDNFPLLKNYIKKRLDDFRYPLN